jgi:hypothetical protein
MALFSILLSPYVDKEWYCVKYSKLEDSCWQIDEDQFLTEMLLYLESNHRFKTEKDRLIHT